MKGKRSISKDSDYYEVQNLKGKKPKTEGSMGKEKEGQFTGGCSVYRTKASMLD